MVRDMKWTSNGEKICIIYEDGAVIVGSVDGNRLWGKELGMELALVEWSPDGRLLLFATPQGECQVYDGNGNGVSKVPLYCNEGYAGGKGQAWTGLRHPGSGGAGRRGGAVPCPPCGRSWRQGACQPRPACMPCAWMHAGRLRRPHGCAHGVGGGSLVAHSACGAIRSGSAQAAAQQAGGSLGAVAWGRPAAPSAQRAGRAATRHCSCCAMHPCTQLIGSRRFLLHQPSIPAVS